MMGLDGLNGSKVTNSDIGYFVFFMPIGKITSPTTLKYIYPC